ncbi:hypothetical protein PMAYCL1PPCAC_17826 [Pristionchus mayeri]|uniref:Rad4 beta-hairpin domain-containing protein n=1 Tax=Pristionchus mayeri TaxID=1317129 RepID=A0AAN5CNC2_9BILA|nr:hypothetical protein PMAYCL1PPCAC_17826 [Pristionchus mayeri]
MPPKRRGKSKAAEGRKRKGKEKEGETPPKKKLASDDEMEILQEEIDPAIEITADDLPSTSADGKGRGGPPQFVLDFIQKNSNEKDYDDRPSCSRDTGERREIPQFVVNIIEKKANERALAESEKFSSSGVLHDEGDKRAATMRELTTLFRILSRGRYEEITEGEAAVAISNTGTDERRNMEGEKEREESSSESEDEWEEMELADPGSETEGSNKKIEVRVTGGGAGKQKVDWKTKWLRTEVNRRVRENRADLEKTLFLSLLAHCRYLTRAALDEQLLPSLMLTTVPSGYQSLLGHSVQQEDLTKLLKWFKNAFRPSRESILAIPKGGYRFGLTARLERLVEEKKYEDCTDAALFLFALFHSFEWTTRLVKNFSVHLPWEKEDKRNGRNGKKGVVNAWVEVWMNGDKKWTSIDPLSGVIMKDEEVEERLAQPLQYTIAVDNKFGVREIAFRFASGFSTPKFRKRRKIDDWIKETLSIPSFHSDGFRARAEDVEFHSRIDDRPVPSRISELKGHPLYVLEKDLKKYEGVYPRDKLPVAVVRNEKVFLRSDVYHLQGSINWIKFGREIKEGEEPYKTVSKRAKVAGGPTESLPLYGYWQTRRYQVPKIVDGKIPHNEFGNIYMYRPEMCPEGGVHLHFPGMMAMARNLDLQAVPAVIGWQCQGGRNVPILDGAVVLEKDVKMFKEEMKKRVKEEEEKELKKREKRIWGNWRRLIIGAIRWKDMNERFLKKKEDNF